MRLAIFDVPIHRLEGDGRRIALTFDDGPNADATPRILDTLGRFGIPATFFVLGKHATRWPDLVKRVADEGHVLGNHGFFHRKLHLRMPLYIRTDLASGTQAIVDASGVRPRLFRAPHGYLNPWVLRSAKALGQTIVDWTLGVWDTSSHSGEEIAARVIRGTRPGAIILLHDGDGYDPNGDRTATAAALPMIIQELTALGYEFVMVTPVTSHQSPVTNH